MTAALTLCRCSSLLRGTIRNNITTAIPKPVASVPAKRTLSCFTLPQRPAPRPHHHRPALTLTLTQPNRQPPPERLYSTPSSWLLSALPNLSSSSSPPPQSVHARRILPYPPHQVYHLIADVSAYRTFLPHCSSSVVRAWASPSATAAGAPRAPALADLTVGWGPFTETYTSRVYCVPPGADGAETGVGIVEAVSGKEAATTIPAEVLRRLGYGDDQTVAASGLPSVESGIFQSLVTRWTVRPVVTTTAGGGGGGGGEAESSSEVTLTIKFQFANAMLGHAVGQLAREKVDEMVEAFEGRAGALYGKKGKGV